MKCVLLAFLGVFVFCVAETTAQAPRNSWRGIVPLHSTRIDAEKVLGKPVNPILSIYETSDERVTVWFSRGSCKDKGHIWNVEPDTVVAISITPNKPFKMESLTDGLGDQLVRTPKPEAWSEYHYSTDDQSIQFDTYVDDETGIEFVTFVGYAPAKTDSKFACPTR